MATPTGALIKKIESQRDEVASPASAVTRGEPTRVNRAAHIREPELSYAHALE